MALKLTIVTAQRTVLEQDGVTKLVVPAAEGQITILPSHAALMSSLAIGEMVVFTGTTSESIAIHGGFIQVACRTPPGRRRHGSALRAAVASSDCR